jgi:hypothetical protein
MASIGAFTLNPGQEPPPRPSTVRPLTFDDVALDWPPKYARHMIPAQRVRDGDRQVAIFHTRGEESVVLDVPDSVESAYATTEVRVERPHPGLRELFAPTDAASLVNLPGLRALSQARLPLDPAAIPPTVTDLICDARALGGVEAVAALTQLERLDVAGTYRASLKPLAALERLRMLVADPGKDLRALGALERLEKVKLQLETATLSNLKAFARWRALRWLCIDGRRLKGLDGIDALESLEYLRLYRPGVRSLAPLSGHPALTELRLHHPDRVEDWSTLSLPALTTLFIELPDNGRLPSLRFLRGLPALEHVEFSGQPVADGDLSPLMELPRLRYTSFYGDYGDGAIEALRAAQPQAKIQWVPPWTTSAPPADPGAIFEDLTTRLDVDTNHEAEDLIRGRLQPDIAARLDFDSEAGAFAVYGEPADIALVRRVIDSLGPQP